MPSTSATVATAVVMNKHHDDYSTADRVALVEGMKDALQHAGVYHANVTSIVEFTTRRKLSELAAQATGADAVVAAELMWCPDEPEEVLGLPDLVESWPELLSL